MKYIIIILSLILLSCDEGITGQVFLPIHQSKDFDSTAQAIVKQSYNPQTVSLQITIVVEKPFGFIKKVNRLCRRFSYGNNAIYVYPTSSGFNVTLTTTHFGQFWNKLDKICKRHAIGDYTIIGGILDIPLGY